MMDRGVFDKVVIERIMDFMPPIYAEYVPTVETINKVNEMKDALMLLPEGERNECAAPMVYLDDMYEMFQESEDLDETMRFIANIFINNIGRSLDAHREPFDFKGLENMVVMELINGEMNSELLEMVPHTEVINMAVIYRVIMRFCDDGGFDSVVVNEYVMKELGVEVDELHSLALKNTARLFEPVIMNLSDNALMVSNSFQTFGASAMLIGDVMREVGKRIGENQFYIIPCSIHEFIAVKYEDTDLEALVTMLAEGNREFTRKKDILSNSIYIYDLKGQKIMKAASYR